MIDDFIPAEPRQAPVERLAAYRITGPDREEFLQGQLSNDVSTLESGSAQLTSYSSPKGRVLAIMRLACISDDWWLLLDRSVAAKVIQRLRMFVLRSDVTFEADDGFHSAVIAGNSALDLLDKARDHGKLAAATIPGKLPRIEIFGRDLPEFATAADTVELRRWDTLSGLLQLSAEHSEQHVAQMLNLDRLGAIHFKKGCYAGQEVIARMHYLGKLKKRALPCFSPGGREGDEIRNPEGKKAGVILQSDDVDGGRLHLAMLNLASIDGELRLEDESPVTLLDTGLGHVRDSTDASQAGR